MTVGTDCAVSACSPLPLSIKALASRLLRRGGEGDRVGGGVLGGGGGGVGFGQASVLSPYPSPVASLRNKAVSTNLASLMASEQ